MISFLACLFHALKSCASQALHVVFCVSSHGLALSTFCIFAVSMKTNSAFFALLGGKVIFEASPEKDCKKEALSLHISSAFSGESGV